MTTIKPILVTGSHRSGSTWVGKTIAKSPSVSYIHEPFNGMCRPGICSAKFPYTYMYITEKNENYFYDALKNTISFKYDIKSELRTIKTPRDSARLLRDLLIFQKNKICKIAPIIKDPMAILSVEYLSRKFDMNVVILIRHPAAFVSSCKQLNWGFYFENLLKQNLLMEDYLYPFKTEIIGYVNNDHDLIDKLSLLWKLIYYVVSQYKQKHKEYLFLRYEDVCQEPIKIYSYLFNSLGIKYDTKIQDFISYYTNSFEYKGIFQEIHSIQRKSDKQIDVWKQRLTASEIKRIRYNVEDISKEFYSDSEW